jgi:hypothetical protein
MSVLCTHVSTYSLWQMGILSTWAYTRAVLGPHVDWEPVGTLGRISRGQAESGKEQQA